MHNAFFTYNRCIKGYLLAVGIAVLAILGGLTAWQVQRGSPVDPKTFPARASPDSVLPVAGDTDCQPRTESNLGVSIVFTGKTCRFTLAQAKAGIKIPYEVRVAPCAGNYFQPTPLAGDGCEELRPGELIIHEEFEESTRLYQLCDFELCDPSPRQIIVTRTRTGTYPGSFEFEWEGRNWTGPSDTLKKLANGGDPFPISLVLTVRATGPQTHAFKVSSQLGVKIVR